jgi:hypothetical protein
MAALIKHFDERKVEDVEFGVLGDVKCDHCSAWKFRGENIACCWTRKGRINLKDPHEVNWIIFFFTRYYACTDVLCTCSYHRQAPCKTICFSRTSSEALHFRKNIHFYNGNLLCIRALLCVCLDVCRTTSRHIVIFFFPRFAFAGRTSPTEKAQCVGIDPNVHYGIGVYDM